MLPLFYHPYFRYKSQKTPEVCSWNLRKEAKKGAQVTSFSKNKQIRETFIKKIFFKFSEAKIMETFLKASVINDDKFSANISKFVTVPK